MADTCTHRWKLADGGVEVPGVCTHCGATRTFLGVTPDLLHQINYAKAPAKSPKGRPKQNITFGTLGRYKNYDDGHLAFNAEYER